MSESHKRAWSGNKITRPHVYTKPGLRATKIASTRNLEWASGFFEGAGSFYSNPTEGVVAWQAENVEPLQRLKEIFGGRVSLVPRLGIKVRDLHKWQISGVRARGVMMTLYTLLSPKRRGQIVRALTGGGSN